MRLFRYKREETLGAFNFGEYQIYVCTLGNTIGEQVKGVTILSSDSVIEIPFPLVEAEAMSLSRFLNAVGGGDVPTKYKLKGCRANLFRLTTYFNFSAVEGGMLKGRITLGMLLGGRTAWVTVKPSSVLACSQSIRELYGIGNPGKTINFGG